MKQLPIGIQNLKKILVNREYVYIDKTMFIKQLMDAGSPYYFISRPRRFGKSLLIDTLKEVFEGNKELFKGCYIYDSDYKWEKYPVLVFDFAKIISDESKAFEQNFQEELTQMAESRGIDLRGKSFSMRLSNLIEELSKENRVVVLVDEYDHPIINNLKNIETAEKNRDFIKIFFTVLKSLDKFLKFTFSTGVSKFSQVSLFSGPNNLKDITMDPRYATMMGYTKEEIEKSFVEHIDAVIESRKRSGRDGSYEGILEELKLWYNGYRFSREEAYVYNPFSTLNYMDQKEPFSYWYSTGTPSFLIDQVKKHPRMIVPLNGIKALRSQLLDISSIDDVDITALMFQTGYLTICDYNPNTELYRLHFPNKEVEKSFLETLIKQFAKIDTTLSEGCQEYLENQNLSSFVGQLKILLSSFPYQLFIKAQERTYQAMLLGLLKGMGFEAEGEKITNRGRIDLLIKTSTMICFLELKLDGDAEEAVQQIKTKRYFESYLNQEKSILIVGINFSSKARNISDWKGALLSSSGEFIQQLG